MTDIQDLEERAYRMTKISQEANYRLAMGDMDKHENPDDPGFEDEVQRVMQILKAAINVQARMEEHEVDFHQRTASDLAAKAADPEISPEAKAYIEQTLRKIAEITEKYGPTPVPGEQRRTISYEEVQRGKSAIDGIKVWLGLMGGIIVTLTIIIGVLVWQLVVTNERVTASNQSLLARIESLEAQAGISAHTANRVEKVESDLFTLREEYQYTDALARSVNDGIGELYAADQGLQAGIQTVMDQLGPQIQQLEQDQATTQINIGLLENQNQVWNEAFIGKTDDIIALQTRLDEQAKTIMTLKAQLATLQAQLIKLQQPTPTPTAPPKP